MDECHSFLQPMEEHGVRWQGRGKCAFVPKHMLRWVSAREREKKKGEKHPTGFQTKVDVLVHGCYGSKHTRVRGKSTSQ